jgi:peptidoglycan/LPS O-acetylase OafA/YrhL
MFFLPSAIRGAVYLSQDTAMNYAEFFQKLRSPFHASLEPLVIGIAVAVAERAGAIRLSTRAATRVFLVGSIALIAWMGSHDFMRAITGFDAVPQPALVACLCGCLLVGAVWMRQIDLPFEPAIRLVARLSYSLYLVHYPLVPLALALTAKGGAAGAAFWPVYLGLSFLSASVLYAAVERPFLILKSHLSRSRERTVPDALPSAS